MRGRDGVCGSASVVAMSLTCGLYNIVVMHTPGEIFLVIIVVCRERETETETETERQEQRQRDRQSERQEKRD